MLKIKLNQMSSSIHLHMQPKGAGRSLFFRAPTIADHNGRGQLYRAAQTYQSACVIMLAVD